MSLPVVLRAEAEKEFDEAFDWYEGKRPGLGVDFAAQVQQIFDGISANPHMHGTVFRDVRKAVVNRFPYCVFYRVEVSQVLVVAVFHSKRNSGVWKKRV